MRKNILSLGLGLLLASPAAFAAKPAKSSTSTTAVSSTKSKTVVAEGTGDAAKPTAPADGTAPAKAPKGGKHKHMKKADGAAPAADAPTPAAK